MSQLLTVDKEKCTQCEDCVAVCPSDVIMMDDGYPAEAHDMCIACGHCVSVCPTAAIDNARAPLARCTPLDSSLNISQAQAKQFIRSRRSIRSYTDKTVDKKPIEELLDLVRYAPSGNNAQGVSWLIIQDDERLNAISHAAVDHIEEVGKQDSNYGRTMAQMAAALRMRGERCGIMNGAGTLLVTLCERRLTRQRRENAVIAQAVAELYAPMVGLGSCWAGFLEIGINSAYPPLIEALNLPDGKIASGAIMLGYSEHSYQRMPERSDASLYWK